MFIWLFQGKRYDSDLHVGTKPGFATRLRQRKQIDDPKVKPAKDTDVCSEKCRENGQDIPSGFSEDAGPEAAKTKTITYCMSNRTVDSGSLIDASFVNASEKQLAVVPNLTQGSSEISLCSDVSEQRKNRKPAAVRKHQRK